MQNGIKQIKRALDNLATTRLDSECPVYEMPLWQKDDQGQWFRAGVRALLPIRTYIARVSVVPVEEDHISGQIVVETSFPLSKSQRDFLMSWTDVSYTFSFLQVGQ